MLALRIVLAFVFAMFAFGAKAETLVVAAPFGEFPALAAQMLDGATAGLQGEWVVKTIDAGCTDEKAKSVGDLILVEKPDAVLGLPCIESLTVALHALGPIGVPIITIASRADAPSKLAVKNKWRLYRIGPRENEEAEKVAALIVDAWKNVPFALLDDGTIFARDTAETIRNTAEVAGLKPVLADGFQPQLESQQKLIDRLKASGASHVFIAGDRANIAQIASEAAGSGLVFAGPETLRAADLDFSLQQGVLMAARDMPLSTEASAKIAAARAAEFAGAEGYTADAYVAAEIAMALKANGDQRSFQTAAGALTIAPDGFIEPVNFALFAYDGTAFQKVSP